MKKGTPVVFVSYSHDSPEHKIWVFELSSALRKNGIDVFLDQWDIKFGDDLGKYMTQSISTSDYVLLICTEEYVQKANNGLRGVGFENMIVTAEIMADIGTSRFIPIVRQKSADIVLPTALQSRLHVNMSEGKNYNAAFDDLIRRIHDASKIIKPTLGRNPYEKIEASMSVQLKGVSLNASTDAKNSTPKDWFERAKEVISTNDLLEWRKLVNNARKSSQNLAIEWRRKYGDMPPNVNTLISETFECANNFSPLFALALAGVSSNNEKYFHQEGLINDILNINGWQHSGYVVRHTVLRSVVFIFQALYGATALYSGKILVAKELANSKVSMQGENKYVPLWQNHDLVGWPESFGRNAINSWDILLNLTDHIQWVDEIFSDKEEWQTAVIAYYMMLSVNEFSYRYGRKASEVEDYGVTNISVPLCFYTAASHLTSRAYYLAFGNGNLYDEFIFSQGIGDLENAKIIWKNWISKGQTWLSAPRYTQVCQ